MNQKECPVRKTSIGGQALIEGVMMKGPETSSLAVRKPDGTIHLETWQTYKKALPWYKKAPIIRGSFNFIDTMITGYSCLNRSADLAGWEEEEPSAFEKKLQSMLGDRFSTVLSTAAVVLGALFAVLLFTVLPTLLVGMLGRFIQSRWALTLTEGLAKIGIFILYLAVVSHAPDIKRVFQYHGAEHKTIACYEAGEPLTPENVMKHTRFHPRCGTSFVLIVLVISVMVFSLVSWDSLAMRILLKFLLLPVVVGIAYEIIKMAGRYDNPVTRFISAPGLWLQNLTTYEPDREMVEVAIAAMEPCIPRDGSDQW